MTDLSPAARAVHSAFHKAANGQAWTNTAIAAALRAVADQLVLDPEANSAGGQLLSCKDQLCAIATELDPSP